MNLRAIVPVVAVTAGLLGPMVTGGPAYAENGPSGCNHSVCLYTAYTGKGYQAWAEFRIGVTRGHHHITGPGLDRNTPDGPWRAGQDSRRYNARGSGQVCAEGWSYSGGGWHSIGLPCVTIG
ncbi:hypothetical protein AB0M02_06085 [Actinoplanes sp. NPDC051861]|uniref:hypothetical protein n=1 Tax=Actinoplanes sp. NPDC051861 TaxID=3155170 RepID=UPI00344874C5